MLDIKYIREHKDEVIKNCAVRRVNIDIEELLGLDAAKRAVLGELEALRAERKKGSKGKPSPEEIVKMKEMGNKIKELEDKLAAVDEEFNALYLRVPNLTHPDSPVGGEEDFRIIYLGDTQPPQFSFKPKDHEELLTSLDCIDFERGTKVAGAKFFFWKNDFVRLNYALINYGMDVLSGHGFTLLETPDVAKMEVLIGAGFNPRGGEEKQIYNLQDTDLGLVATAEITVLGYHANEVIDLSAGPKKYAALSHCFRQEAGAYGRTSKGLYRVHQFTKLEMFIFCRPEDSEQLHAELLAIEKEIADGLELPYRVIDIPTGDLGGPAYRKYDLEGYMVMKGDDSNEGGYGEITSTSNCTDYQARRMNIKYRKDDGSTAFVHTLNGTAVVLSRFPLTIAENFQTEDGSIRVPKVLQKYMGKEIIKK